MIHTLAPVHEEHAISSGLTDIIAWGTAIMLMAGGYPVLIGLIKYVLTLLYELFIQYQW